jgi:hypothetical protein
VRQIVHSLVVIVSREIAVTIVVDVVVLIVDVSARTVTPVARTIPAVNHPVCEAKSRSVSPPVIGLIVPTRISPRAVNGPEVIAKAAIPAIAEWQAIAITTAPVISDARVVAISVTAISVAVAAA